MNVLELKDVSKHFKDGDSKTVALSEVSLTVKQGEFLAVMGPSGSGKSTLLNIIGLLDTPTSGSLKLSDETIDSTMSDATLARLRRERIGFIFQSFNLLPKLDLVSNVELPMIYAGEPRKSRRKRAAELLTMVGLKHRLHYRPNQISGGESQRVAVARSLANHPDILLADEPTGNLDTKSAEGVMDILAKLNQENGVTILMITHNPELTKYAGRTLQMQDGHLSEKRRR